MSGRPDGLPVLERLRRYEDEEAGISEEFVDLVVDGGRTWTILAQPLGDRRPFGWIISPSLASEQANLRRLEGLVARALAGAGFPTLRIRHRVGSGATERVTLSGFADDLASAVDRLATLAGVERAGVVGARLGGTVAALVADRLELAALALWSPVVQGARYARSLLRLRTLSNLVNGPGAAPEARVTSSLEQLGSEGEISIRGSILTRTAFEQLETVDLARDLVSFHGKALLIDVTADGCVGAELAQLAEHLESLGAETVLEGLVGPSAPLGEYYFRPGQGFQRVDTRVDLDALIAATTTDWARDAVRELAGVRG